METTTHKGKRRKPKGWLRWGAPLLIGAAVLISVTALVLGMKGLSDAACAAVLPRALSVPAAVPQPGDSRSGHTTFFDLAASGGSGCSYDGPPADGMYLALGFDEFANGAACGTYFNVTGPNGNTVRVQVVDSCAPCAPGHIDMSEKAFSQLADPEAGDVPVTYRAIANPKVPGPLRFKAQEVSEYYVAVLPINHGNQLTKVEIDGGNGWQTGTRRGDGYYTADNAGSGPFRLRLTDLQGHVTTVSGVNLSGGSTTSTGVSMYSGSGGGSPTTKKSKSPSPSASPKPSHTLTLPPAIGATDAPTPSEPAVGRPDTTNLADPETC